jgi:cytochrome oxidase Cu insertion factor (SCO1/SenC/PrrC family)
MFKRIFLAAFILASTALILVLYLPGMRPQHAGSQTVSGAAAVGGPFTLVDTKGESVTESILNGHYSIVYFGYTYCPDLCPLALQNITEALQMAGPVADDVLPVFITIDPERDTKEAMAEYIAHFHPRLIGLTGTPAQIQTAEQSYRVYAAKEAVQNAPGKNTPPDYAMAHTDYIYLMDRNGRYVTHFVRGTSAKDMAARLRRELNPA